MAASQGHREPQSRAAADADLGLEAIYQKPNTAGRTRNTGSTLSFARSSDRPAQPGVVCGHHLHPDVARLSLSGCGHGLVQPVVLAWRLSNTLDADFCVEAVEAHWRYGRPEIFNTDQGAQFTSDDFTGDLARPASASAWTARAAAWTTSSSSGCGAA